MSRSVDAAVTATTPGATPAAGAVTLTGTPIDPVSEADAYRRMLLGLLGRDDPVVVQAATEARLRRLVAEAGHHLRDRPTPTEWSLIECLGHLVDGELVASARIRWILAEDEPDIVGYDQDRWVDGLRHRDDDPETLLALFGSLRAANIELWRRTTHEQHARAGRHRERGRETVDLMWHLTAGHDRFHLAQAERALAAVRRGPRSPRA